ncbi:cysteine desulfurase NifS [Candidatus Woesearchaeota archaeon CG_4_10_14_0_2_um_filter_33_10]|nr:MAG: cysteine desulfurase NifS [Candidatus Woesearchaeota archaeon CG10_big_fil_rev_8_21_14_0_10_33_12]PIU72742.1 MAG: cysteine desulfurase NifS [Candidatus Woesearchaeota archaeon CG06_land_8_20_14_3_00_33_13]PIZ51986.1 MAG: cysteine desulfurase NifS [Candidatus Woesearchaeota archaeon CG_4_10_14_0_2_um_filter_33_10]
MKRIYLDNGATTMLDPKVIEAMLPYFTAKYGNASSAHSFGEEASEALEKSRAVIAKSINANPDEIIFTSGGTESNNFALKSIAFTNKNKGNHIIVSKVEHKCIMKACKWLEQQGFNITYLGVDKEGFVNPDDLEKAITDKTILVSIIHGNNETGTINDLKKLGDVCKKHSVYFHTDACQSYTKTEINVKNQDIDLITLNAHKIHGPKGIGALYIRKGTSIKPWQHGGDHEFGMRAGTEDIPGIVGFAEAVKIAMNKKHIAYMANLRDILIKGVLEIPEVKLNGPIGAKRLCNSANFTFKGIEGEAIGGYLNNKGIASSTGSACSARTLEPSYVLMAIGLSHEQANSSLRLTLSRFTTKEEIDYTLKVLLEVVKSLRKISPFWEE